RLLWPAGGEARDAGAAARVSLLPLPGDGSAPVRGRAGLSEPRGAQRAAGGRGVGGSLLAADSPRAAEARVRAAAATVTGGAGGGSGRPLPPLWSPPRGAFCHIGSGVSAALRQDAATLPVNPLRELFGPRGPAPVAALLPRYGT